eukprot:s121_g17.t1
MHDPTNTPCDSFRSLSSAVIDLVLKCDFDVWIRSPIVFMDMDTTASRRASIAATEGRRTDARESLVSTIGDYMAKLEDGELAKEMEVIKLKQEAFLALAHLGTSWH